MARSIRQREDTQQSQFSVALEDVNLAGRGLVMSREAIFPDPLQATDE